MPSICKRYIEDVSKKDIEVLNLKQEKELSNKIQKGCGESFNKLIEHNLRLVIKTSQRYEGCGIDSMDLINEGNIGLMQAAKKYKASKGTKFSTYAGFWIRQKMIRYINNHSRTIRIPCHAYSIFNQLKKIFEQSKKNGERLPSVYLLSKRLDCSEKKIKTLLPYVESPVILDAELGENGEDTKETQISTNEKDASMELQLKERILFIEKALNTLSNREKYIIKHRFGLHGDKKQTLEKIGQTLKLTRERIRQIEKSALHKLSEILDYDKIQL